MREIWLLRHGATEWSESGRYCGWADPALSPPGRREVLRRRADITQLRHQHLWSSDLQRCVETARIVAGEPSIDPRLRELDFGRIEGLRFEELDAATQNDLLAFDDFVAPGGESFPAFRTRIDEFLDELTPGRHLIVTHGGVIRLLLRRQGLDSRVPPGGVVRLSARLTSSAKHRRRLKTDR